MSSVRTRRSPVIGFDKLNLNIQYSYDTFSYEGKFFGNGKKGYVPLYSVIPPADSQGGSIKNEIDRLYGDNLTDLEKSMIYKIKYYSPSNITESILGFKEDLLEWLNIDCKYSLKNPNFPMKYSYKLSNVASSLISTSSIRHDIGAKTYHINYGMMYCESTKEILYSLVVKKEHIKLIKLLLLLKMPIPNNIVQMWVNPTFNTTNGKLSKWKSLRSIYKRTIEPILKEKGVKTVYIDDIVGELYNRVTKPKVNSLKEYNTWISRVTSEFLRSKRNSDNENELNLIKTIMKI
jgi:hypothetical protein